MDELYRVARRVLLDALEALGPHRDAVVLVGAQAIYLQTGEADFAVAAYTTDADLALDPAVLRERPPLEHMLAEAGFHRGASSGVGVWKTTRRLASGVEAEVQVDLLVPSAVSPGKGRRAARLLGHEPHAARKVNGLEGALVDRDEMTISALDPGDARRVSARVAGPGALLIAKLFKISERAGSARANDKDALDVLRILQCVETADLASRIGRVLADERSRPVAERASPLLNALFGTRGSEGAKMAARASRPLMEEAQVRLMCEALARELLAAIRER